ncbi:hypothetical protein [Streptomyces sulphureus]|uniref:hypothetical protein n=1 Tax=Streptomyces sulphureus TaxID=47758 RepID=UPI00035DF31F|nr:hypothetical protein [Streptomyces sulphureus]
MSNGRDIDAADWVDDDLLTRDEAGERLRGEIDETRARLAELEGSASPVPAVADSVRLLRRRLSALEEAHGAL